MKLKTATSTAPTLRRAQRLLSVKQVAKYLNVSPVFIYKATRQRRLPVTRIGRTLRFDPAALEQFIARQTTLERTPAAR